MSPKGLRGLCTGLSYCLSGPCQRTSSAPPLQPATPQQAFHPSYTPGLLPAGHRLSLDSRAGGVIYLSDARTAGGIGGGVGVRDTIQDRFILQANLNYLMMLGNAGALRINSSATRGHEPGPRVAAR